MKSEYEKYINEVREMKKDVYEEFKKSGHKSYVEFIKDEAKGKKILYRRKKKAVA